MSPELEEKLYGDFRSLFANRKYPHSPMAFGCEHGDGWYGILREACEKIDAHKCEQPFLFVQVKEKWGTLRLYYSGGDEYTSRVIKEAETKSGKACEGCGQPGTANKSGWISTLCDGCRKITEGRYGS